MTLSRYPIAVFLALLLTLSASAQQPTPPSPQAGFLAYHCAFQPETNTIAIQSVLTGADGLPMPTNAYTLGITPTGGLGPIPPGQIIVTPVDQRPPLRIILVLDVTHTVPLPEIVSDLNDHFLSKLQSGDQVALLAFGQLIAPLTQFYTDKTRLVSDQLNNLHLSEDADNRLYDAILQAVTDFPSGDSRQVVLVLTDSRRRQLQQAPADTIIQRAHDSKTQIFTIGYHYQDDPDDSQLISIANGTAGYPWIIPATVARSRTDTAAVVGDALESFVKALNSEVTLTVDMRGQQPINPPPGGQQSGTPPPGNPNQVEFNISVDPSNDPALTDTITCPLQPLHHSIAFDNVQDNEVITNSLEIKVNVQTDLATTQYKIVFWLNDTSQAGGADVYIFNALNQPPGQYRLRAQLLDGNNAVLAATPILNIYSQQVLQLDTLDGKTANLSGAISFQVITGTSVTLPDIQFSVSSSADPSKSHSLGSAPVQNGGRAVLNIPDLQATLRGLFSDPTLNGFQISASVPSPNADQPPLALSNAMTITLLAAATPAVTAAAGAAGGGSQTAGPIALPAISLPAVTLPPGTNVPLIGSIVLSLILLVINYILMRRAYGLRINRLINSPDDYELTDQLMTLTVQQDGIRKSHILTKKTLYVGRGSFNDINLGDDEKVSRQHGVVMWRKGQWYYANRKALVKTKINGKRYRGYALFKLEPVTELQIGDAYLYFHSNAQQDISELAQTNL